MRKYLVVFSVLCICLSSCGGETVGDVIVQNASDYDATNVILTYKHGNDGEKTETVGTLPPNTQKKMSLVIASSSWMSYVASVGIKFWQNSVEYGDIDFPYGNGAIVSGKPITLKIINGGYEIK